MQFGLIAVGVTMLAQVLPSIGAARHTIVSYKQEMARTVRKPWWQRAWLDVLLLIPAVYGIYLSASRVRSSPQPAPSGRPLRQPAAHPAAGAGGAGADAARPASAAAADGLCRLAGGAHEQRRLSARHTLPGARAGLYSTPLILLMLTLGLSVFTASLAQTLDNHLFDQSYYAVGADARLVELGASPSTGEDPFGAGRRGDAHARAQRDYPDHGAGMGLHPGGRAPECRGNHGCGRVGDYESDVQVQDRWVPTTMIGVDRIDFPKVAFWRDDFAPASLGALMNSLAIASDGVLMERSFMRQNGFRVGDVVQVRIRMANNNRDGVPMRIVGDFRYFPTWYAAEYAKPLLVANLEWIFEQAGGEQPYDVWIKTDPNADFETVMHRAARSRNLRS